MLGKRQILLAYVFLCVAALIVFRQVSQCDFISYDDTVYVTDNVHIRHGITMEAIRWAFTTFYAGYWHPLTCLSHMLDVQLFGFDPGWHHLTNLLFHTASTLLLFFVFHRMTKATWQSAFVAALFALHPLRVESVAWVAERKDVLSVFFWMLTMAAYVLYVEHPRFRSYLAVLLFLVLGLMAKPMLVTLPFVLLLLDFWPLRRIEEKEPAREIRMGVDKPVSTKKGKGKSGKKPAVQTVVKEVKPAESKYRWTLIRPLILEKIPLFAMAALFSVVTIIAEQKAGAVVTLERIPPGDRIANAFVSYIIYIGKMIWPDDLAVFYPHHEGAWPLWQVLGAVFLFIAVTLTVIRTAKRFPYVTVGWLWYAGTLVPVLGIVQVGNQSMADRFTYIPHIGLYVIAAWGIPELLKKWRYRKEVLVASSVLILSSYCIVAWTQVGYWKNSITLMSHALEVTGPNYFAHANRGLAYGKLGNHRLAIEDYDRAIEIRPQYSEAYNGRGISYGWLGDYREAVESFDRAIAINPEYLEAFINRGAAHGNLGNHQKAVEDFDRAIGIDPQKAEVFANRGAAHAKLGDQRQAISDYDSAIAINPKYAEAYYNRGVTYGKLGNTGQAFDDLTRAAKLNNENAKNFLKSRGMSW